MYLRSLTNEELLRYADPVTELERELFRRLDETSEDLFEGVGRYEYRRSMEKLEKEVWKLRKIVAMS